MKDILTEQEAKERWCPLFRVSAAKQGKEGTEIGPTHLKCLASDCMAWRRAHSDGPAGTERGFCGAFGIPRYT